MSLVGILAAGIAANVVAFQCVDRLVLNPLPLPDAGRIVVVGSEMPRISQPLQYFEPVSGPELAEIRDATRSLVALLPFDLNSVRMQGPDFPMRLFGGFVWSDPLPLLGVGAALGRGFTQDEIARGDAVAILSHGAWSRDFGSDSSIVGRTVMLDDVPHAVVGVTPPYATIYGVDVWVPMAQRLEDLPRDRRQFNLMARMPPSVVLDAINADLTNVAAGVENKWSREDDAYAGWRLQATSLVRSNSFAYADEAVLVMVASLLILLLICVNIGNLALVRGAQGRGAAATRLALGGGPRRLALDAIGEALVLGVMGGGLGHLLAAGAFGILNRRLPGVLQPLGPPLSLDGSGILFGTAITLGAVVVLATASVAANRGVTPRGALAGGSRSHGSTRLRFLQRGLVAAQLALGLALATGAGAVGSAVARILLEDPGFAVGELASMRLSLPADVYEGEGVPLFFRTLVERVAALPGVRRTSVATQVAPNTLFSSEIEVEGSHAEADARPRLFHTVVAGGYFEAMDIPVVAGRALDERDRIGAPPAVVLNESAAERLFPGTPALGERIRVRGSGFDSGWAEVVGISADVRNQGQGKPSAPEVFTAHAQAGERYRQMFLVVRAQGDPAALIPSIRAQVRQMDPAQPVYAIGTPRDALAQQVAPRRTAAYLLLGLSALAVVLAGVGLHGVLSYTVATRRGELAVRASLGAAPATLRALLFGEVVRITSLGLGGGLLMTLWLGWLMRASLGEAVALSVPVVVIPALVMAFAAVLAGLRPALTVGRTDPVEALRLGN